jgi:hypothetical protein
MIGGDPKISEVVVSTKWRSSDAMMFPEHSGGSPLNMPFAILILVQACTATDPFIDATLFTPGIIETIITGVFVLLLTQGSIFVYTKTWRYGRAYTFESIWAEIFGQGSSWIVQILVLICYLSFVIFSATELLDYTGFLLLAIWPNAPSIFYNKYFLLYFVFGVFILPCTLAKDLSSFRYMSMISIFLLLVGLACLGVSVNRRVVDEGFDPDHQVTLFGGGWREFFVLMTGFNYIFFVHPMIPWVMKDLDRPTVSRCVTCVRIVCTIALVLNLTGCFLTYACFTEAGLWESVFLYLDPDAGEVIVGTMCSLLISLMSCVLYTFFCARTISTTILGTGEGHRIPDFAAGLTVLTLVCVMMFAGDMAINVESVMADMCFVFLEFGLPMTFYLWEFRLTRPIWSLIAIVVLIFAVGSGVISLYINIEDQINDGTLP